MEHYTDGVALKADSKGNFQRLLYHIVLAAKNIWKCPKQKLKCTAISKKANKMQLGNRKECSYWIYSTG